MCDRHCGILGYLKRGGLAVHPGAFQHADVLEGAIATIVQS
jgi:hypothetical protein